MSKQDDVTKAAKALSQLGAAKGGRARAASLAPGARSAIALKAADARWGVRRSTHEGPLMLLDIELPSAVLDDETRVLSERGFLTGLGLKFGGKQNAARMTDDGAGRLPLFLAYESVKPFVPADLVALLSEPIKYRPLHGGRTAHGIKAELIPRVCGVWLDALHAGKLSKYQQGIARRADIILRGLAHVGIIALVDEATGYQKVRQRHDLHKILALYVAKEMLPWSKRFPDEFYEEMFRLRRWSFDPESGRKPILVGTLTDRVVYKKLPPGVREELRKRNPRDVETKKRKHKHHQLLTVEVGHPHLEKHLAVATALMRASRDWKSFTRLLDRAVPDPQGQQGQLFDEDEPEDGKEAAVA